MPPTNPERSSVEFYRSIHGGYSWKVTVCAEDDSEAALRKAKALAVELHNEFAERYRQIREEQRQQTQQQAAE